VFARILKQKNKDGTLRQYFLLCKAIRQGKKIKQVTVANLGRLDENGMLANAEGIIEKLLTVQKKYQLIEQSKSLLAHSAKTYGPVVVFESLWKELGIGAALDRLIEDSNVTSQVNEALFCIVLNRLLEPHSKLGTFRWKETVYRKAWEDLELQHFFRSMDVLAQCKEIIEQALSQRLLTLFNLDLTLVLMDTTTVMYDGEGEESELLERGYSRDKRPDLKQAVVGVMMTREGIPLACEVYAGNLSDQNAFPAMWRRFKERFPNVKQVIFVCDRGSISDKNLTMLEELKYDYIIGVRMRSLSDTMRLKLLSDEGFHEVCDDLQIKEANHTDEAGKKRRYIVAFNPVEAAYEKKKRVAFRKALETKIRKRGLKDWLIKNGYKKYIRFLEGSGLELDEKRFDQETMYDGKWVLLTSTKLPAKDVALHYKGLALVERGFRAMKSEFEVHPMHHRVTRRIETHIFLCFLALVLRCVFIRKLRDWELRTKKIDEPLEVNSYLEILEDLEKMKAVDLEVGDRRLVIRTELEGKAYAAFQAIGKAVPPQIVDGTAISGNGVQKSLDNKGSTQFRQLTLV